MPSLNRVILVGRLTRDPELRYTAGGLAVTSFTIAVDRRYKNQQTGERQTDFLRCKAWRQKAEFVANYITKGRLVAVDGSIETSEVTGQDGQKKYFTDIICDNVEPLEGPRDGAGDMEGGAVPARAGGGMNAGGGGGMADDSGYFPDEDMAPAPPVSAQRPAPRAAAAAPAEARPAGGGGRPAAGGGFGASGGGGNAAGGAARRPAAPPRQPEPAYPEGDYDDSDPFADE
jgi:single-strand DNA-binding protein